MYTELLAGLKHN